MAGSDRTQSDKAPVQQKSPAVNRSSALWDVSHGADQTVLSMDKATRQMPRGSPPTISCSFGILHSSTNTL